jgi:hypothetical protein
MMEVEDGELDATATAKRDIDDVTSEVQNSSKRLKATGDDSLSSIEEKVLYEMQQLIAFP